MHQEQISTHAPAGGATKIPPIFILPIEFLLTPLREGRLIGQPRKNGIVRISTHAPAGGATPKVGFNVPLVIISTHAPAGGATRTAPVIHPAQKISTHAPAGGATGLDASIEAAPVISTHAPAGGATQGIRRDSPRLVFLLTPLREGRHRCLDFHHRRRNISTHAPAGGATASKTCTVSCVFVFLLTPLREGRLHGKTMNDLMASFLLTPLREGRQQFSTSPS